MSERFPKSLPLESIGVEFSTYEAMNIRRQLDGRMVCPTMSMNAHLIAAHVNISDLRIAKLAASNFFQWLRRLPIARRGDLSTQTALPFKIQEGL
jgi:hypothetical protein